MMKRVLYLDMIRILACLMIIAMHAPIPDTGLNNYLLSSDSLLTAPGIGLFVMVSGALLLPVNISTGQFLKKRFSKIVCPTIFWTVFYFVVAPYTETLDRNAGIISFLSIPFSPQFNGVLWFMYMLAGLYLLAPILSAWLIQIGRREIEFYLCLWFVTLCYPIFRNFIKFNEGHTGILYYFGGYAGYFLLGYYLRKYVGYINRWFCALFIALPCCVAAFLKLLQVKLFFYEVFGYLSVFVVMMAIGWFMLLKRNHVIFSPASPIHRFIVQISNCCFGIYLIHIFVMRSLLWKWPILREIDGTLQIVTVTILTFLISFIIIMSISSLPWSEYIIGYKQGHK